mmetsp:Transcript_27845/g.30424  ORF Transcript_27845/g.30424 Transcript_27845/m.30424 type:complete len:263 (-) Transcript_27845:664-1452(-)
MDSVVVGRVGISFAEFSEGRISFENSLFSATPFFDSPSSSSFSFSFCDLFDDVEGKIEVELSNEVLGNNSFSFTLLSSLEKSVSRCSFCDATDSIASFTEWSNTTSSSSFKASLTSSLEDSPSFTSSLLSSFEKSASACVCDFVDDVKGKSEERISLVEVVGYSSFFSAITVFCFADDDSSSFWDLIDDSEGNTSVLLLMELVRNNSSPNCLVLSSLEKSVSCCSLCDLEDSNSSFTDTKPSSSFTTSFTSFLEDSSSFTKS